MTFFSINKGWLQLSDNLPNNAIAPLADGSAQQTELDEQGLVIIKSPHCSARAASDSIRLLVIHNISLPPGEFGGPYITDLFMGRLAPDQHPYFKEIHQLQVSAHCLVRRTGQVIQYVSFTDKAWHAGISCYQNTDKCNDFSIGIELEGTDDLAYTAQQYRQLVAISQALLTAYPQIQGNIVGHCDIAPDRKTDPGAAFDWQHYFNALTRT